MTCSDHLPRAVASSHPPDTEGSPAGVHAGSSVVGGGEQGQDPDWGNLGQLGRDERDGGWGRCSLQYLMVVGPRRTLGHGADCS